jgi:hypothetical protein
VRPRAAQASDLKAAGSTEACTLVDFLLESVSAQLPHLLAVPDELRQLQSVRRLDYDFLRSELERLSAMADFVAAELQYAKLRAQAGAHARVGLAVESGRVRLCVYADAFERVMAPFVTEARSAVAVLKEAHAALLGTFPEVVLYFGESPDSTTVNELMQGAAKFAHELTTARDRLAERTAKGGALLEPLPVGQQAGEGAPTGRDAILMEVRRRRAAE